MSILCAGPKMLKGFLAQASFAQHGDRTERHHGQEVCQRFPGCEVFWRFFVVPATKRMLGFPEQLGSDVHYRDGIDPRIQDIVEVHYTAFVHLVAAHEVLDSGSSRVMWLEDFYSHLVSSCDLAETLIEKWHLLLLDCRSQSSRVLQLLSREDFLDLAAQWYDESYGQLYEHYLTKGKSPPLKLPATKHLAREFLDNLGKVELWKEWCRGTQPIRDVRNALVHNTRLGKIMLRGPGGSSERMPKAKEIHRYRTWRAVSAAASNPVRVLTDFVEPRAQAASHLDQVEQLLNQVWDVVISAGLREFYADGGALPGSLYDIRFTHEHGHQPPAAQGTPQLATVQGSAASGICLDDGVSGTEDTAATPTWPRTPEGGVRHDPG